NDNKGFAHIDNLADLTFYRGDLPGAWSGKGGFHFHRFHSDDSLSFCHHISGCYVDPQNLPGHQGTHLTGSCNRRMISDLPFLDPGQPVAPPVDPDGHFIAIPVDVKPVVSTAHLQPATVGLALVNHKMK